MARALRVVGVMAAALASQLVAQEPESGRKRSLHRTCELRASLDTDGVQGEIDAYPRFGEKLYGFVNVGYSGSDGQ